MDDAGRPAVEFLDGGTPAGSDEALAGAPPRDSRHRVLVLLGTLLVVGAGALVARAAQGSGPGAAASASSASTRTFVMPPPEPTAPSSDPGPGPAELSVDLPCHTASCVILSGILPTTDRAVRAVFPNAVLREGYSIMSDDLRSLRSRNVRGELGGQGIVLDVGAAPVVRHLTVRGERGRHFVRAVARVSHYRVTVTVSDPRVSLDRVMRLARDPALIAPR
jgi:hypothetical protein